MRLHFQWGDCRRTSPSQFLTVLRHMTNRLPCSLRGHWYNTSVVTALYRPRHPRSKVVPSTQAAFCTSEPSTVTSYTRRRAIVIPNVIQNTRRTNFYAGVTRLHFYPIRDSSPTVLEREQTEAAVAEAARIPTPNFLTSLSKG